jgi:hypothetical protein
MMQYRSRKVKQSGGCLGLLNQRSQKWFADRDRSFPPYRNINMINEQKLIDLCFSLVLHYRTYQNHDLMQTKTQEETAEWVADNLRECGFPTTPTGMSWGVLKS